MGENFDNRLDPLELNSEINSPMGVVKQVIDHLNPMNINEDKSIENYTKTEPMKIVFLSNIILLFIIARLFFALIIFILLIDFIINYPFILVVILVRLFDILGYIGSKLLNLYCSIIYTIVILFELIPLIYLSIIIYTTTDAPIYSYYYNYYYYILYLHDFGPYAILITTFVAINLIIQANFCRTIFILSAPDKVLARNIIKSNKVPFCVCFSKIV